MNAPADPILRISWESVSGRTEANRLSLAAIKGISPDVLMTFWGVDWLNGVEQFRKSEEIRLGQDGVFESTMHLHRALLAELIAQGETLVYGIRQNGIVPDAHFTLDDIRATIETLRETFQGVHGPHNHPETKKSILRILEAA